MCYNCRETGHSSWECTWPEMCRVCKGIPHLAKGCVWAKMRMKLPECCNCGGIGHLGWDCASQSAETSKWSFGGNYQRGSNKKTWSSRPAHPAAPLAAIRGQGVLKGESLCPSKGPFGVGPTERGHTKDRSLLRLYRVFPA